MYFSGCYFMLYPIGINIRYLVGYWDIDVTNHLNRQFFYVSFFEKHITINTIIIIITSPSPSFSHMLNDCLVGGIPTPLKNMSSSVGMMTFPIYGKINSLPNHQPVNYYYIYIYPINCHKTWDILAPKKDLCSLVTQPFCGPSHLSCLEVYL